MLTSVTILLEMTTIKNMKRGYDDFFAFLKNWVAVNGLITDQFSVMFKERQPHQLLNDVEKNHHQNFKYLFQMLSKCTTDK